MNFWLSIISDYETLQVSLCQKDRPLQTLTCDKNNSNKELLTLVDTLLGQHNLDLRALDFIGVNAGPGPYTSLRVAISTANALSFATGIPLVGINALVCFLEEHATDDNDVVALLNAFNNEVFYGIKTANGIQTGYIAVAHLPAVIDLSKNNCVTLVGNGIAMYRDQIKELFAHITLPAMPPAYASQDYIINHAWQQWCNKQGVTQELFPLYLKQLQYKSSVTVS